MGFNNKRSGIITREKLSLGRQNCQKRLNFGEEKCMYTYRPKDISPRTATAGAKDDGKASHLVFTFLVHQVQNAVYETIPTIKMAHNAPK